MRLTGGRIVFVAVIHFGVKAQRSVRETPGIFDLAVRMQ